MDTSAHGLWHNVAILALDEGGNQKTIQTDHTLIASDLDQYLKYLPEGYRATEIVGGFDGETWEDSIPVYCVYYDLEDRGEDRESPAHIKPINHRDVGKMKRKDRIFGRSRRWHYTSIDNLFHKFCKTQPQIGNDSATSYNTCYSQAGTTWSISTGVRSQQGATWEGTRTLNLGTGFAGGAPYSANYKGVREGREDEAAEHGVGRTGKAPGTVPTAMVEAMRAETRLSAETLAVQQRLLDDLCIGDVVR